MTVDRNSATPMYRQLAALIRDDISSGRLAKGAKIPSLHTLAQEHDMAVVTVQQAIDLLKTDGLVYGVPGKGTFVA